MMTDRGGVPGIGTSREAGHRRIMLDMAAAVYLNAGLVIDGAESRDPLNTGDLDVLRAGVIMGRLATKKYAPSILGVTTVAYTSGGTELTVGLPTAVELVRREGATGNFYIIGPPTAAGTVVSLQATYSAVDVATGVITVTNLAADKIAGCLIMPNDTARTPLAFITDGYGLKVTDEDSADIDIQWADVLIGGKIIADQIVNYGSNAVIQAWIKTQLNTYGQFIFDDDFTG